MKNPVVGKLVFVVRFDQSSIRDSQQNPQTRAPNDQLWLDFCLPDDQNLLNGPRFVRIR